MRVTWLPDVLRAAGLDVVEQPGWRGRGAAMTAVEGVFIHHTASSLRSTLATNLAVVTNGNGTAPGPIAQVMFWRDGTAHMIADGRCNHGGAGGPWGWLPESPKGQLSIANARTIGFECVNNGVGEEWSPELVSAMEIASAAVIRHLGVGVDRVVMHSEWAPGRKIDPAGPTFGRIAYKLGTRTMTWDGNSFRARVAGWMAPPPPEPTPDPEPPAEEADDVSIIVTNAEPHPVYGAPGTGRFLLLDDGTLRHISTMTELATRGDNVRASWSNAELAAAGLA